MRSEDSSVDGAPPFAFDVTYGPAYLALGALYEARRELGDLTRLAHFGDDRESTKGAEVTRGRNSRQAGRGRPEHEEPNRHDAFDARRRRRAAKKARAIPRGRRRNRRCGRRASSEHDPRRARRGRGFDAHGGGTASREHDDRTRARGEESRSTGVDGMNSEKLWGYWQRHWPRIREELLSGTYAPRPSDALTSRNRTEGDSNAGHPDGTGSDDPTSPAPSLAAPVRPDVFGWKLRRSSGAQHARRHRACPRAHRGGLRVGLGAARRPRAHRPTPRRPAPEPGRVLFVVQLKDGSEGILALEREFRVEPSDGMLGRLEKLFGEKVAELR